MSGFVDKVRKRLRQDDVLYDLSLVAASLLVVSVPALAPVAIFLKIANKKKLGYSSSQLRNTFYSFRRQGFIAVESKRGRSSLVLTEVAWERISYLSVIHNLSKKMKQKWKGKWYVVLFDIKNERTPARNALRLLLRRLGFVQLQKSAWVFPHDCTDEVNFLRSFFKLNDGELRVIVTEDIGNDADLRIAFGL